MDSMAATTFFDVNLASYFKDLIINTDNVLFDGDSIKDFILNSNDNKFLMVKKRIGSNLTILSAVIVDDALLRSILT